jgi:hypothetical protein
MPRDLRSRQKDREAIEAELRAIEHALSTREPHFAKHVAQALARIRGIIGT